MPGDELELELRLDGPRKLLSFALSRAGEACSAGVLDFSGEFAADLEDMSGGTCG